MLESRPRGLNATYRVQMHAGFTLRDALAIVPYLDALGTSHLYASPVLMARTGSQHGYDVVDPHRINPELGGLPELEELARALHERGMGLLLDIVPNHMGIGQQNPYWEDVLTHGERSRYAKWFDIDWGMHADRRLVLPFLSGELDEVIGRGELRVVVTEHGIRLHHFDNSVPVSPDTAPEALHLAQWDPATARETEADYQGVDAKPRLLELLDRQHYRLVGWRRGPREINYRRFFDVNDLVALRMEDPAVFAETHTLILDLVARGIVDGLRIDHIDGLKNPRAYLARLDSEISSRCPGGVPVFVEKILAQGERLPDDWPVQGTTGYERLNDIVDLFVSPEGFARIEQRYRSRRREADLSFGGTVRADKRAVLDRAFAADVERLSRLLMERLRAEGSIATRDQIFHGIEEFIAAMPVYRTYVEPGRPLLDQDVATLESLALVDDPSTVANRIRSIVLSGDPNAAEFICRIQQLTGPAMAKGLEDTAHYAYIPLVSRNEVGGAPDRPLDDVVGRFHAENQWFAAHLPASLVTTSTHDTKRSGDVRARISALSEIADEWQRSLARWRRLNRRYQTIVRGRIVPDPNAELLIYQTLVGIWPAPRAGRRQDDVPERSWRMAARDRMQQYVRKAVREAKLRTSWTEPDAAYEKALDAFVAAILDGGEDDPFLSDLSRLVSRISRVSWWNTMSRILLHMTMPGTPDIYQGDESWNFALVDPDNRRPVNYGAREASLGSVASHDEPINLGEWESQTTSKTLVMHRLLITRRKHAALFAGAYRPLKVTGGGVEVVAFARVADDAVSITIAPRLICRFLDSPDPRFESMRVEVPGEVRARHLRCAITHRDAVIQDGLLDVSASCRPVPFGLFVTTD
jgi:(1->4)-alpha-D-glucan 1-alpha-D-glucosylmutase